MWQQWWQQWNPAEDFKLETRITDHSNHGILYLEAESVALSPHVKR